MFQKMKVLTFAILVAFSTSVMVESVAFAQKSRRPSSSSKYKSSGTSSKPKFGQSTKPPTSSYKPPTSSTKPKFGQSTKPPTSSYKPPTSSTKPKFGQSTKPPTTGSKPPSTSSQKPKFGQSTKPPTTGSKPPSTSSQKPKFGQNNSNTSARPPTTQRNPSTSSQRPGSTSQKSSKAKALSRQASQIRYEETKKATAPPKSSYTTSNGKTVNIRKDSKAVETIRSRPSSYYTPQQRTHRTEIHFNNYGYSHPYDYYYSRPTYYVGGGYSSAFWWMMQEWSAERRARWLYNNQANIERSAYERGMQDAAVAAEIARLQSEGAAANPNYIDPEFAENPDLMFTQDYVEASYNPTRVPPSGGSWVVWAFFSIIILGVLFWLFFVKKWNV